MKSCSIPLGRVNFVGTGLSTGHVGDSFCGWWLCLT